MRLMWTCSWTKMCIRDRYELVDSGAVTPELVIGVPVGFVNVVESKELFMQADIPWIIAVGRKGGSNVAAAICNALLYYKDEVEF